MGGYKFTHRLMADTATWTRRPALLLIGLVVGRSGRPAPARPKSNAFRLIAFICRKWIRREPSRLPFQRPTDGHTHTNREKKTRRYLTFIIIVQTIKKEEESESEWESCVKKQPRSSGLIRSSPPHTGWCWCIDSRLSVVKLITTQRHMAPLLSDSLLTLWRLSRF